MNLKGQADKIYSYQYEDFIKNSLKKSMFCIDNSDIKSIQDSKNASATDLNQILNHQEFERVFSLSYPVLSLGIYPYFTLS